MIFWALFKIVYVDMVHPKRSVPIVQLYITAIASLIIVVIFISVFGNLKRIIRIKIMLKMFGKLSNAASIVC